MNTPDLEELERLLAKATPGDWVAAAKPSRIVGWPIVSQQGRAIGSVNYVDPAGFAPANAALNDEAKANAALIVALRNAAPFLIATAREVEGLRAEVARLTDELRKANEPLWFYAEGNEERCLFSPDDAIDWLDLAAGEYVTEVSTARPCKSIWCAVRVTDDRDADERFTFTEHSTELEARAALYARGLSIVRKETVNG
ncbi:MAG: hypothetical protein ACOY7T_08135 [Pseudomonadota bacterium]